VLEPAQAAPVIIEDEPSSAAAASWPRARASARAPCSAPACVLTGTIPVIDAETGAEVSRGHVPPWSVAVSATRMRTFAGGTFGLPCVLVIKRLREGERHDKSKLNDILRDHGATV
jgi:2,3,4,5-tetrahydropyridine-2,6-dicarboxylate N-succinyltransferase